MLYYILEKCSNKVLVFKTYIQKSKKKFKNLGDYNFEIKRPSIFFKKKNYINLDISINQVLKVF